MGWLRLVGDLIAGGPGSDLGTLLDPQPVRQLLGGRLAFFRIASVFGTGFLPHRATTLGLPGLVTVVLLVVTCLDRRPAGVLLAGVARRPARAVPVLRVPGDLSDRAAVRR